MSARFTVHGDSGRLPNIPQAEAPALPARERRSIGEWAVRLALMVVALAVAQLGVTLFVFPALGSDPYTLLAQGVSRTIGLSVGLSHMSSGVLLLIVLLATTKGYVLPGTLICTFFSGPFIDLYTWLFGGMVTPESVMPLRLGTTLAGIVVTGTGLSLLIRADGGLGANDLVPVILSDKFHVQYRWVKVGCDTAASTTGFLLGGALGLGTLLSVCLVGPIAQLLFPVMDRLVYRALGRSGP